MKRPLFAAILAGFCLGLGSSRAATPTPEFKLLQSDGQFSVREYPELLVAVAPMQDEGGGSFRKLFGFISGKNEKSEKISMTAPVLIDRKRLEMSFIMPGTSAPKATDPTVVLQRIKAGKFAVVRFSGLRNDDNEQRALARLRDWIRSRGLQEQCEPVFAYYNPPWTLPFLRRNEVLIRVL